MTHSPNYIMITRREAVAYITLTAGIFLFAVVSYVSFLDATLELESADYTMTQAQVNALNTCKQ